MRQIKTKTTDYLFQSILYLNSSPFCPYFAAFFEELTRFSSGLNFKHGEVISRYSFIPSGIFWQI